MLASAICISLVVGFILGGVSALGWMILSSLPGGWR